MNLDKIKSKFILRSVPFGHPRVEELAWGREEELLWSVGQAEGRIPEGHGHVDGQDQQVRTGRRPRKGQKKN